MHFTTPMATRIVLIIIGIIIDMNMNYMNRTVYLAIVSTLHWYNRYIYLPTTCDDGFSAVSFVVLGCEELAGTVAASVTGSV